jgi:hypothetical protein
MSLKQVDQTLEDLHAILDIPEPSTSHHPSFCDFLLDKTRCRDPKFWVDEKQTHHALAASCIRVMFISLKQKICGVRSLVCL